MKDMFDVDVKDLLETGRIVIEKQALDTILMAHTSDIGAKHSMKYAADVVARARGIAGGGEDLEESPDNETVTMGQLDEMADINNQRWY